MGYPLSYNSRRPVELISSKAVDAHIRADSLGNPDASRYGTYFAHLMAAICGDLPTRIGGGTGNPLTHNAFGMGINDDMSPAILNTSYLQSSGDEYSFSDGRCPMMLGGKGQSFPHDGTHAYASVNGFDGSVGRLTAQVQNDTASAGILRAIIREGETNYFGSHLLIYGGSNGAPNRNFEFRNGGGAASVVATINPSTDIAGFLNLSEDQAASRGAVLPGHVNRISKRIEHSFQIGSNESIRVDFNDAERRSTGSNTAINDGTVLTFVGWVLERLDSAGGGFVGGNALYHNGGSGWNYDDWAADELASGSESRRISVAQDQHLASCLTFDQSRRAMYVYINGAENASQAVAKARTETIIARHVAEQALLGRPKPFVWFLFPHKRLTQTVEQHRTYVQGVLDACRGNAHAGVLDGAGFLGWRDFDGGSSIQNWLSSKGLATVTFGNVADGDISDGDGVNDGEHQTNETWSAFFMGMVYEALTRLRAHGAKRYRGRGVGRATEWLSAY